MQYYSITVFCLFLLMYVWLIVPDDKMIKPFILEPGYQISAQFYLFFVGIFSMIMALSFIIAKQTDSGHAWIIAVLFAGFLTDYLLHYLQPYGYLTLNGFSKLKPVGFYFPISYPMLMGIILFILTLRSWK